MDTDYSYYVEYPEDTEQYRKVEKKQCKKCDTCQIFYAICLIFLVSTLLATMGYFIHQNKLQHQDEQTINLTA